MLKSDPHKDHGKNVPGGGSSRCKDYEGGTNSEGVRTCEKQRGEQGENGGPVGRGLGRRLDVFKAMEKCGTIFEQGNVICYILQNAACVCRVSMCVCLCV